MEPTHLPPSVGEALRNEQEGVTMTTSPTGTPRVAPRSVPWLLALVVALGGGLGVCAVKAKDETVRMLCEAGAVAVGGGLGVISPGLRRKDGAQ